MSATRPTIIEFVEKYTHEYSTHVFLREKVDEKWTETSFEQTRKEGYRIAAGLMAMGLNKGERVSLLSEGRNMWILSRVGNPLRRRRERPALHQARGKQRPDFQDPAFRVQVRDRFRTATPEDPQDNLTAGLRGEGHRAG